LTRVVVVVGVQATCTVCTATSIITGPGRCRGYRHTSGQARLIRYLRSHSIDGFISHNFEHNHSTLCANATLIFTKIKTTTGCNKMSKHLRRKNQSMIERE